MIFREGEDKDSILYVPDGSLYGKVLNVGCVWGELGGELGGGLREVWEEVRSFLRWSSRKDILLFIYSLSVLFKYSLSVLFKKEVIFVCLASLFCFFEGFEGPENFLTERDLDSLLLIASSISCMIDLCVVELPECGGLTLLYCDLVILCKGDGEGKGGLVWEDADVVCKEGDWYVLVGFDGFL